MKDIWKESIFYYIAVPAIIALWPLLVGLYYIPNIEQKWEKEKENYTNAYEVMDEIRQLDPDRLAYRGEKKGLDFDYATAIYNATNKLKINPKNCNVSSKPIRTTQGRKTRNCQVVINEIKILTFAQFLSNLQITWANLQAEKITLTRLQELPDSWKIDLTFKYYY
ncbi:MAG: hypothetical protein JW804_07175 [Sedimentisphaerales bacterium]|nr:hypothetical protein [Sedimentisphaerales bacterium]